VLATAVGIPGLLGRDPFPRGQIVNEDHEGYLVRVGMESMFRMGMRRMKGVKTRMRGCGCMRIGG
jgi:hypothetical protein